MNNDLKTELVEGNPSGFSRRKFFGLAGGLVAAGVLLDACKSGNDILVDPQPVDQGINLGSGDVGVLNYAYALEQLEAAFYTQVAATPYSGITASESALLTDIRDHEVAHREFFKRALGGSAIATLTAADLNFTSIDFGSRASVLGAAKAFEDLGVNAYNGAGKLLQDGTYLLLAGKIVSVEARHAAYIRDLVAPGSFADTTDANGLDTALDPPQVLAIAGTYLRVKINASNLPTS